MMTKIVSRIMYATLILFPLGVGNAGSVQDQDATKEIKAAVFIKARPVKKTLSTAKYRRVAAGPRSGGVAAAETNMSVAQIGITFWRFRPSKATDKTKELVEEEGEQTEWTLERMEAETPLSPGQKVRISIESLSRDGYLYVINREGFADGSLGDPVLIFPTAKNADKNRVQAGRLIYIPSATGRFRIKPSDSPKTHVAEVLTIIVSPKPLLNSEQLGSKPLRLSREQVESWQKQWGVSAAKFEMDSGVGQAMTQMEQSAASESSQLLSQDDPVPQTVYEVPTKPNNPLLITVPLRFAKF